MPSMESNYVLNVAKQNGTDWQGKPRYLHFVKVELGSGLPERIMERAREVASRFPAPEYQCDLTYWQCSGTRIPLHGALVEEVLQAIRDGK